MKPDDLDVWTVLAEAHARAGDPAAAAAAYERAAALAPDVPAAHFGYGTTLALLGRGDEAVTAWKRALALDSTDFVVRKQIWAHRHPEKFWPEIDAAWQREEMARERAGRSDLTPVPPVLPAPSTSSAPPPVPAVPPAPAPERA